LPRSANRHARFLARTGWSTMALHLLRGRCPLGVVERHPPRGPSRDRYGLRRHMSWPGLGSSLASVKSAQRRTTRWWPSTPRRSGVAGWDGRLGCRRLLVTVPVAALLPGDGRLRLPAADDALGRDLVAVDEAVRVRVVAGKPGVAARGRAGPVLTERTYCRGAARPDWVAAACGGHRHRPHYRASSGCCHSTTTPLAASTRTKPCREPG
jgi:hypothetical protein